MQPCPSAPLLPDRFATPAASLLALGGVGVGGAGGTPFCTFLLVQPQAPSHLLTLLSAPDFSQFLSLTNLKDASSCTQEVVFQHVSPLEGYS